MQLQGNCITDSSWIFLSCRPKRADSELLRSAFLVSVEQQHTQEYIPTAICNFYKMATFFKRCMQGDVSIATLQRGYRHLKSMGNIPRELRFEEEVHMFELQFQEKDPGLGLNAFLTKSNHPFESVNPSLQSLWILSDWLALKSQHHPDQ